MFNALADQDEVAATQNVPTRGTSRKLSVRVDGEPGSNIYRFIVRKNRADTPVACTVTTTQLVCADLVNTIAFAPGDEITVRVQPSGAFLPRILHMRWTATFTP